MGLFLTALGTLSMVMGTIEYWYRLKALREFENFRVLRPSFVMAVIMSLLGLSLFVSISSKLL
jgi:putative membrane protein